MSALDELKKKPVMERTALDNAVIFSRHGEVEQAAAELAFLRGQVAQYSDEVIVLREWKDAVGEECSLVFLDMTTPTETVRMLIRVNSEMALDPQISEGAKELIEKHTAVLMGRVEGVETLIAKLREAQDDEYDLWAQKFENALKGGER